jgi:RNA polymerase sigma-70 factor, ECF subfamily
LAAKSVETPCRLQRMLGSFTRAATLQARYALAMIDARNEHDQRLAAYFLNGLAGDAASYREFLLMLEAMLRSYFRKRLTERAADVDDLVQEALLAVHRRRHTYERLVPVTVWIHAIARHKFIDLLRADAGRAALFEPLDDGSELVRCDPIGAWQAHWDLQRLLGTLPDKQRAAIEAVKLQGLSVLEAARSTGLSESAVKVYVHRGLRTLATRVPPRETGDGLAPA